MFDFNELKTAAEQLILYYKTHCNPHQLIIIDTNGIRVVSDECGIPLDEIKAD